MNDTLINAYQNELTFMKQERNKWKERTKKAVKERNNLQSKIDKAIELYENTPINCDGVAEDLLDKIIFDILKEEK